jgi:Family of unknown function (DUF6529)
MTAPAPSADRPDTARLAIIGLIGLVVTGALYAAGRLLTPNYLFTIFGQSGLGAYKLKSALTSVALGLAALQVVLALWIYGKLPLVGRPTRSVRFTHRGVGLVLLAVTAPVAVHCLIAYGVQLTSLRVAVHSLAGCFFYGVFAAKVLVVQSKRMPGWVFPLLGGLLAVLIAVLWYTSALWYYNGFQLPSL